MVLYDVVVPQRFSLFKGDEVMSYVKMLINGVHMEYIWS